MRLRIHHGAHEIGGNCIELESGGQRLLLDLGLPIDSAPVMPPVPGLQDPDPSLLGVVLSHPHLDHYGLLPSARSDLPVWLGEGALQLLEAAAPFTPGARLPQRVTPYRTEAPFEVGPFRVTPYLMDHSAYDAHALLVEAEGRRILYSGDFRGHGRKAGAFERFLSVSPTQVDVLMMEGTTIGRREAPRSERDVEDEACALMRSHEGLVLACFSGQNLDRFVTFLRAAMRSGRTFVIDAYMANLVAALRLTSLPDPRAHPNLRVFLPKAQKRLIVASGRFDLIEPVRARRIYNDELLASPGRFAMSFRASMVRDLAGANLAGGCLIYSLWPGYLDRDRTDLRAWAAAAGAAFEVVHASGHAAWVDLERMAQAVDPKILVPIHTERPEAFRGLFSRVRTAANGEWLAV
jgi:ribonuclease J